MNGFSEPGSSAPGAAAPPAMWLVPHTHWDREWYEPHDVFRARLVVMVDALLDLLESEPDYRFTLDGQSAAFEDYLEIRPEAAGRLRSAVERGQLAVGPFLILLDEFCCDGETIVRNLELGIEAARRVGTEMRVGYLPDMFGHAAQMPQILRGFGIADAALWRGVPDSVREHAFEWEALDGERVRVEYLWDGYGSALKLFDPLDRAPELIGEYLRTNAAWFRGEPAAGMFGTDHMLPRQDLVEVVEGVHEVSPGLSLRIATVGEVIDSRDHTPEALGALPLVRGELRSHARGNILPGVFSVRTNIKAAMAAAERALTTAERLDAWAGGPSRSALFRRGWRMVVESTAHDSVTGCGVDETAEEVESRLHVATHTARGAIDTCLPRLAACAPRGSVAVFNQSGWGRTVLTEVVVERTVDDLPADTQLLEELDTVIGDESMTSRDLPRLLRRIHGQELFGGQIRGWSWEGRELVFEVAESAAGDFDLAEFSDELSRRVAGTTEDHLWHVLTVTPPRSRVLVGADVPGNSVVPLVPGHSRPGGAPVEVDGASASIGNSLVTVRVRPTGLVEVEDPVSGRRITDALGLVDEGDRGDSYNFGPLGGGTVREPVSVDVDIVESGPLRGRIRVRRRYRLPRGLDPSDRSRRSSETVEQEVDTHLELRVGEPFLRVEVELVNTVRDHRLRVLVPTGVAAVAESSSAGQFGVTTRGRGAEGGWGEFPLPTFPATRFVRAGSAGVLLDKLTEYELVDRPGGGTTDIALTVLRAVGLMSVNVHPLRDEPAGSELAVPGAQYVGVHVRASFALDLSAGDGSGPGVVEHSDVFRFDPVTVAGSAASAGAAGPGQSSGPLVTEGRVALESLRRVGETGLEARLVNYGREPEPMRVRAVGSWSPTDMEGLGATGPVDLWDHPVPAGAVVTLRSGDALVAPDITRAGPEEES